MSFTILKIEGLSLRIRNIELLRDFSFNLAACERVGITGPSGCGKSTLLRSVVKNELPDSSVFKEFTIRNDLTYSYIPQSDGLLPWFSLGRNLKIFGRDRSFLGEVIKTFKLGDRLQSFPHELSGGEYQRSILAAAIANTPTIYLADEPLTELDISNKWELLPFWSRRIHHDNAALILVSHDIETLIFMSDRVVVLSDKPSKVLDILTIDEPHPRSLDFIFSSQFVEYKKRLLGAMQNPRLVP